MVKDVTLKQFSNMGLCRSLAMCVKEVADRFFDERLPDDLGELDDMDIATRLLDIKGIGRWTVARFLQRHTGRPDVFTLDRHMRAAMRAIFPKQLQELQKGRQEDKVMEVLAVLVWPGHRTLASDVLYHMSSHGLLKTTITVHHAR